MRRILPKGSVKTWGGWVSQIHTGHHPISHLLLEDRWTWMMASRRLPSQLCQAAVASYTSPGTGTVHSELMSTHFWICVPPSSHKAMLDTKCQQYTCHRAGLEVSTEWQ